MKRKKDLMEKLSSIAEYNFNEFYNTERINSHAGQFMWFWNFSIKWKILKKREKKKPEQNSIDFSFDISCAQLCGPFEAFDNNGNAIRKNRRKYRTHIHC